MKENLPGLGFPARNIFCIGRNYAQHARELGNAVPESPVVFLKPVSAQIGVGESIRLPAQSQRVDHEVEIVVTIGRRAREVGEHEALGCVAGYAIGIDLTARDLQEEAKKKALPWAIAKGFDTFAPVGEFVPASAVGDPGALEFSLDVNGQRRQTGHAREMLFSIPRLISFLSTIYTLDEGDLIYTGTPAGVAPLAKGDRVVAELTGFASRLELEVR